VRSAHSWELVEPVESTFASTAVRVIQFKRLLLINNLFFPGSGYINIQIAGCNMFMPVLWAWLKIFSPL